MKPTTDTPRTDACPHCGAKYLRRRVNWNGLPLSAPTLIFTCGSKLSGNGFWYRSNYCQLLEARDIAESYREARQKAEAEVERLKGRMKKAEDLIKGLHGGWRKARKAHLETCKNAQREIDKLHAENVCLQELIQEFYEWSRRDFPTEQEVREIMNRYHDILNK